MADQTPRQGLATLALHAGQTADPTTTAAAVPIYATSSYVFESADSAAALFGLRAFGNIYSRLTNPTNDVLEKRLAALDGGVGALAFASGAAAITAAVLTLAHSGQNIVSATSLYGGTWSLFANTFPGFGIEVRFFDPSHPEEIEKLIDGNTRLVYLESVGNPKNDVPDFRRIADIAHSHGLPFIVDNTVLTPALFRPFEHGVDIVVYSTTKFLGGHGVHVGGAIVDSGNFDWTANPQKWSEFNSPDPAYHGAVFSEALKPFGNITYIVYVRTHLLRDTGAAQSPFAAFLILLGIETLTVRLERHVQNAQALAEWLLAQPAVEWVNYPGLPNHPSYVLAQKYLPDGAGAILGFGVRGGKQAGIKFINSVKLASHLANVGDAKTLVIHPASTTHSQLSVEEQFSTGVTPEYVRVSVGIEDIKDIQADFEQALKASQE
ncbi:MAG: aminotransferase class I/II-fold pyridoxal phosphate-dependent enzyme [Bryobacteraceae bacterium]|nr:aminotransferase class I/II-fold pyridoxal phosphate-dependent enzyme [Bryobacteraceae bacterium]